MTAGALWMTTGATCGSCCCGSWGRGATSCTGSSRPSNRGDGGRGGICTGCCRCCGCRCFRCSTPADRARACCCLCACAAGFTAVLASRWLLACCLLASTRCKLLLSCAGLLARRFGCSLRCRLCLPQTTYWGPRSTKLNSAGAAARRLRTLAVLAPAAYCTAVRPGTTSCRAHTAVCSTCQQGVCTVDHMQEV